MTTPGFDVEGEYREISKAKRRDLVERRLDQFGFVRCQVECSMATPDDLTMDQIALSNLLGTNDFRNIKWRATLVT